MATSADNSPACYTVDDLTLDLARRRVERNGRPLELNTLSFDLLRVLVTSAPEPVTYDELAEKAWGRRFVSQEAIAQRVKLLRQALSEDGAHPRYIESVRGKGYRLKAAATIVAELPPGGRRRRWHPWPLVASVVVVGVVAVLVRGLMITPSAPLPSSVAVLPLATLSSDSSDTDCASAMHAEINYQLTRSGLTVISRGSVLSYAQDRPSFRTIARTLKVESVLEGTIRCESNRMHLVLELIDPVTGANRWSNKYEAGLEDVDRIQADIATQVAAELKPSLSAKVGQIIAATQTNFAASVAFARAIEAYDQQRIPDAIDHLTQAIKLDTAFGRAYAYRAVLRAITLLNTFYATTDASRSHAEIAELVLEDADHALSVDAGLGMAYVAHGMIQAFFWNWRDSRASFAEALAASPNDPDVVLFYTIFMLDIGGDRAQLVETARQAVNLAPYNYTAYGYLAGALEYAGDFEGSLDAQREAAVRAETHEGVLHDLAIREYRYGSRTEAERLLRLADQFGADDDVGRAQAHRRAYLYALLGLQEDAVRNLRDFEAWGSAGARRIGLGDQAFVYLAKRDFESALRVLQLAGWKAKSGELDEGFWRLRDIRINRFGDPVLVERHEFVDVREQLVGR